MTVMAMIEVEDDPSQQDLDARRCPVVQEGDTGPGLWQTRDTGEY